MKNINKAIYILAGLIIGLCIGYYLSLLVISDGNLSNPTHDHPQISISSGSPVPKAELKISQDANSGYNIQIITDNFTFTPEASGSEPIANTGHAHLYVNDRKVARLYGDWYHLSEDKLTVGNNDIRVTLNANDHSEWAINGETISTSKSLIVE